MIALIGMYGGDANNIIDNILWIRDQEFNIDPYVKYDVTINEVANPKTIFINKAGCNIPAFSDQISNNEFEEIINRYDYCEKEG